MTTQNATVSLAATEELRRMLASVRESLPPELVMALEEPLTNWEYAGWESGEHATTKHVCVRCIANMPTYSLAEPIPLVLLRKYALLIQLPLYVGHCADCRAVFFRTAPRSIELASIDAAEYHT